MTNKEYFYKFLNQVSPELGAIARELENSVFSSPRTMLTHTRVFVEDIIQRVLKKEEISDIRCSGLLDRIQILDNNGLLTNDVRDAIHTIRKSGNDAAHNTKAFRYSEALRSWEALYVLVKWFMEVYGPLSFEMPNYQEPKMDNANKFDVGELELRFKQWEETLLKKVSEIAGHVDNYVPATDIEELEEEYIIPGDTELRTITYKGEELKIPYFLRDAFLLPQRFEKSERFMIALGGAQQARIMSELPSNLEGISKKVKRYKEENEALMFNDLCIFVEDEQKRRKIMKDRPGELFLFFWADYIIITEKLEQIPLDEKHFAGIPNFLRQLQEDGINKVGQLPQELLILAKYDKVGIGTVEKLFRQIKEWQTKN